MTEDDESLDLRNTVGTQTLLMSLSHDFVSPFTAMIGALENMEGVLAAEARFLGLRNKISHFIRDFDRETMPYLQTLHTEVKRREGQSFDSVAAYLRKHTEPRIEKVVAASQIIENELQLLSDNRLSESLDDLNFARRKIRNMLNILRLLQGSDWPLAFKGQYANINKNIDGLRSFMAGISDNGMTITVEGEATIAIAPGILHSVLQNLLSNAWKYRYDTRTASVDIDIRERTQHEIAAYAESIARVADAKRAQDPELYALLGRNAAKHARWMELTARDFGIGIPKEKILSVFKVYKQLSKDDYKVEPSVATILKQRRKHNGREDVGGGGYGFGLAISQYYARLCGGELVADSQIGGPTTFCLWLPTGKRGSVQDSVRPSRDVWWTR